MITVSVVDSCPLGRLALKQILSNEFENITEIRYHEFENWQEILTNKEYEQLDLLLINERYSILSVKRQLVEIIDKHPHLKCILGDFDINTPNSIRDEAILFLRKLGLMGYFNQKTSIPTIARILQSVLQNQPLLSPIKSNPKTNPFYGRILKLTAREKEILAWLIHNHNNESIADGLSLSIRTVETHRSNAFHKLQINTPFALSHPLFSQLFWDLIPYYNQSFNTTLFKSQDDKYKKLK